MSDQHPYVGERGELHDRGDHKGPRQRSRPIRTGQGTLLRRAAGSICPNFFLAHAWLEAGSIVVVGEASVEQVTPIAQFK
jgi:hypothetical protein